MLGMRYETQLRGVAVLVLVALVFLITHVAFDLLVGGQMAALGAAAVAVVAGVCFVWVLR
jgi:hypothetical protein